jgi:hypothetical protein
VTASETALSKSIRTALEAMGLRVLRLNSGKVKVSKGWMYLAPKGTPDLQVELRGGRVLWLEVKLPGEQLNADQVAEHERLTLNGHTVCVVRSPQEAIDAVIEAVNGFRIVARTPAEQPMADLLARVHEHSMRKERTPT